MTLNVEMIAEKRENSPFIVFVQSAAHPETLPPVVQGVDCILSSFLRTLEWQISDLCSFWIIEPALRWTLLQQRRKTSFSQIFGVCEAMDAWTRSLSAFRCSLCVSCSLLSEWISGLMRLSVGLILVFMSYKELSDGHDSSDGGNKPEQWEQSLCFYL